MSNRAGLRGLVIGPYRWSAATYSSFIRDAYNIIKVEMERLHNIEMTEKRKQAELTNGGKKKTGTSKSFQIEANNNQNYDLELEQFVEEMISESSLVLGNENWVDIIGTEYWNILKLDENGKDRYKVDGEKEDSPAAFKKKSVVPLLKLIRDKIEHIRTYKDDVKGKLIGFFDLDDKGQYQFNENKFVTFWISKFPKLMPWLWINFYKYKWKLAKYYPDSEINTKFFLELFLDLNKFVKEIQNSLFNGMENGNVMTRFKGQRTSLEFRGFDNLVNIFDNNAFITVAVNLRSNVLLSVSHSSKIADKLEYIGTTPEIEQLILIFADNIEDDQIWTICTNCDCRVIVFCDPDKLASEKLTRSVCKFREVNQLRDIELPECPLKGNELSRERQDWLFKHTQLSIQCRDFKMENIFSDSSTMAGLLSGYFLNKLLKNHKLTMFAGCQYPKYEVIYIDRKLYFWDENVNEARLEHVYVAFNTSKEYITKCLFNSTGKIKEFVNVEHLLIEKQSVEEDCDFIVLAEPKEISDEIVKKCELAFDSRRLVRFLHFDNRKFSSRFTSFPFCTSEESRKLLCENEFLRRIHSKKAKTVYFLAQSGMGKSKLLLSLGNRLENSLVIFYSFRQFVDLLRKNVGTRECSEMDIKSVLFEILECKNECERMILHNWLKYEKGARIELQLDGLDEVPSENLNLALRALEIIDRDFIAIRIWITSTKPFPSEKSNLNFTNCSISPFDYTDKFNFFKQSWSEKYAYLPEKNLDNHIHCLLQKLKLNPDLNMLTDFTDYPLNCSLLAQHYEDKVPQLIELRVVVYSVDLYESLTNKKFAIMYSEKKGIPLDETDHDFKMQRENYLQLHTHLALVHLFPQVSKEFTKPLAMKYLSEENFRKMGIITSISPVTFSHLTYADFFVARYIIQVLETGELDHLCSEATFNKLQYFGTSTDDISENIRFSIWVFVDEYLVNRVNWKSLKWLETLPKSCEKKELNNFLTGAIEYGIWNLARLLINLWVNCRNTIWCNQILQLALISGAHLDWFKSMCEELSFNNQNELVIYCVKKGYYEIAMYLIDNWCGNDVFDRIADVRGENGGGGIFHFIVDRIIKQDELIHENGFIKETIKFIRFVHDKNKNEINRNDQSGRNLLLGIPLVIKVAEKRKPFWGLSSVGMFSLKELLIRYLNADVNELSFDGESVLSLGKAVHYKYNELDEYSANIYYNILSLKASKNFAHVNLKSKISGLTPLGEGVHLFGSKLKNGTLEIFRDLGANFNELDEKGGTVLHYCVENCDDIEFIKLLIEFGCEIDIPNGEGQCALCLAEKVGKVEIKDYFRQKLGLAEEQTCGLNCIASE